MKLLRLIINSGYKMLEKGFTIDFLTKTRVDKKVDNSDLIELVDGFYYPIETVFIGKNSSGKTTVIQLISTIINYLTKGRMKSSILTDEAEFSFETLFFENGYIYKYNATLTKKESLNGDFLIIDAESLQRTLHKPSYKKDLSNVFFPKDSLIKPNIGSDTSDVKKYALGEMNIMVDSIQKSDAAMITLMQVLSSLYGSDEVFNKILHLFDDSIEYIKPFVEEGEKKGLFYKRINKPERLTDYNYLSNVLSAGTMRGIYVFMASLIAFRIGGTILIDEFEKSFNKNLVQNLILLFNDVSINKANATLLYTTHYGELLDDNDRVDNINVLHRNKDSITITNLCTGYDFKVELLKSNYFNQNAFDNLLNYNNLMDLRRAIK